MNDTQLLNLATVITDHSFKLAQAYFSTQFAIPSIMLNQRGKIAGSAHLQKNIIKLNRVLFVQNTDAFEQQVIPHEVAHLVCYQKFGHVKPHGEEWRSVMRNIYKLTPAVTHKFDVTNVGMKEFSYKCECAMGVMLSAIRHNKVLRGTQQYRCQKCRSLLTPDGTYN